MKTKLKVKTKRLENGTITGLNVRESRLANGLRVVSSTMPHVESVSMGIWVGVGGRYEARTVSGASHFIEHLLFKGTERRSARAITQSIEGRGGDFNAFTQEESTCYYARIAYDHLPRIIDVLSDMYLHPRLNENDIEKERGVIMEEMMMYRDQPHQHVQDMLGELLWPNHALGRPLIGTAQTITGMTRDKLSGFKSKKYLAGNTVCAFAGRIDHDDCVARVEEQFGELRRQRAPTYPTVSSRVVQQHLAVAARDIEQTHMAIGIRLFGRHDRRRYALRVLSVILGENMSSRLFQVVRERHGLAYSIHAGIHLYEDTGVLDISAGLDRRRYLKALRLIVRELKRLKDTAVGAAELRRAKDYITGQIRIGLESTSHQMMWLGDQTLSYGMVADPEESIREVMAVTPDQLQRLAVWAFRFRRTSIAVVAPAMPDQDQQALLECTRELG